MPLANLNALGRPHRSVLSLGGVCGSYETSRITEKLVGVSSRHCDRGCGRSSSPLGYFLAGACSGHRVFFLPSIYSAAVSPFISSEDGEDVTGGARAPTQPLRPRGAEATGK